MSPWGARARARASAGVASPATRPLVPTPAGAHRWLGRRLRICKVSEHGARRYINAVIVFHDPSESHPFHVMHDDGTQTWLAVLDDTRVVHMIDPRTKRRVARQFTWLTPERVVAALTPARASSGAFLDARTPSGVGVGALATPAAPTIPAPGFASANATAADANPTQHPHRPQQQRHLHPPPRRAAYEKRLDPRMGAAPSHDWEEPHVNNQRRSRQHHPHPRRHPHRLPTHDAAGGSQLDGILEEFGGSPPGPLVGASGAGRGRGNTPANANGARAYVASPLGTADADDDAKASGGKRRRISATIRQSRVDDDLDAMARAVGAAAAAAAAVLAVDARADVLRVRVRIRPRRRREGGERRERRGEPDAGNPTRVDALRRRRGRRRRWNHARGARRRARRRVSRASIRRGDPPRRGHTRVPSSARGEGGGGRGPRSSRGAPTADPAVKLWTPRRSSRWTRSAETRFDEEGRELGGDDFGDARASIRRRPKRRPRRERTRVDSPSPRAGYERARIGGGGGDANAVDSPSPRAGSSALGGGVRRAEDSRRNPLGPGPRHPPRHPGLDVVGGGGFIARRRARGDARRRSAGCTDGDDGRAAPPASDVEPRASRSRRPAVARDAPTRHRRRGDRGD